MRHAYALPLYIITLAAAVMLLMRLRRHAAAAFVTRHVTLQMMLTMPRLRLPLMPMLLR